MSPVVPVLSQANLRSWPPKSDDAGSLVRAAYMPLAEALSRTFTTDAHVQLVSCPTVPHRLRKDALGKLTDGVPIVALLFDVDAHELAADERNAWWQAEQVKIAALLAAHPGAFVYRTRGGYRIVYLLAEAFVVRTDADGKAWHWFYQRCCLHLARAFAIDGADIGCKDWTREFRLPHATRDHGGKPENLDTIGNPHAIDFWAYSPDATSLDTDLATARQLHQRFAEQHPGTKNSPYGAIVKALRTALEPPTPAAAPAGQYVGRETARGRTALDRECSALASMPKGTRNPAINEAALKVGHYVNSGELAEQAVIDALLDACRRNGSVRDYGEEACRKTIASGLSEGKKTPPSRPLNPTPATGRARITDDGELIDDEPAPPPTSNAFGDIRTDDGLIARHEDIANGKHLVAEHGRDLLYCAELGGWFVWDGQRFVLARHGEHEARAKAVAARILAEAQAELDKAKAELAALQAQHASLVKAGTPPDAELTTRMNKAKDALAAAKAAVGKARAIQRKSRIEAMLAMAVSEPGIAVRPEQLDVDPYLLTIDNGTLNLRTGKLQKHDRRDGITKLAPVTFDATAQCPAWQAFLATTFSRVDDEHPDPLAHPNPDTDLIGFVQRHLGSCLTGDVREECAVFWWGGGSNGKTTLSNTIERILGDYCRTIDSDLLLATDKTQSSKVDIEKAHLKGMRLAVCAETKQGRVLDECTLKQIASNTRVVGKLLYADTIAFNPTHKAILQTNHKPIVHATDEGTWRRIKLVPFRVTIPADRRDKTLPEHLLAEASGILNWLVEGCRAWQASGLGDAEAVKAATSGYRVDQDTLGQFLQDRCVVGRNNRERASALYQAYAVWSDEQGEKTQSSKAFGLAMTDRGYERTKYAGNKIYQGLRLKTDLERGAEDKRAKDAVRGGPVKPGTVVHLSSTTRLKDDGDDRTVLDKRSGESQKPKQGSAESLKTSDPSSPSSPNTGTERGEF